MEKPHERAPLESLHPDFSVSVGGNWIWNKNPALHIEHPDRKVMFIFDETDCSKFDRCPSIAKIGRNQELNTATQYPYIAFVYGTKANESELITFAQQFTNPQLIEGLTSTWVSKEHATITDL